MNYRDLNILFNDNSYKFAGSTLAARRLEKRMWKLAGKEYKFAGIGPAKERGTRLEAHFTCTESLSGGGCWHNRVKVDIGCALDCLSGNLESALIEAAKGEA